MKMNQIEITIQNKDEIWITQDRPFEEDDVVVITSDQAEVVAKEIFRLVNEIRNKS